MSVDGANDHRGALVHLSDDSPGTITEETPSVTVTPTQSRSATSPQVPDVVRRDLGRDRAQDQAHRSEPFSAATLKPHACAKLCTHVCIYFGVFATPKNTWLKRPSYRFTLKGADS